MMDSETKKILSEQEKLKLMTEHEGWGIARKMLTDKILELQMIGGIDKSSPENAIIDLKARELAAHLLYNFLVQDIEGSVQQLQNNGPIVTAKETLIVREQ